MVKLPFAMVSRTESKEEKMKKIKSKFGNVEGINEKQNLRS